MNTKSFSIPFKYRLLIPMIVVLLIIIVFPLAYSFVISFQDAEIIKIGQGSNFVGLKNYIKVVSDRIFWIVMRNTVVYVLISVSIEFVIGFFLANLLYNKKTFGRSFFRSTFLTPLFITPIAVGLIFRFLLNTQIGVVPKLLQLIGININWFDSKLALFSMCLIDVWQWTPLMILLLLAGMESLPEEPFEAAIVDGARGWRLTFYLTLPMLKPVILASIVIRMLDAFKVYEYIYAITRGGPGNATECMQYFIYRTGFTYFRAGEASAMSYIFIIVILIIVIILFNVLRREAKS